MSYMDMEYLQLNAKVILHEYYHFQHMKKCNSSMFSKLD